MKTGEGGRWGAGYGRGVAWLRGRTGMARGKLAGVVTLISGVVGGVVGAAGCERGVAADARGMSAANAERGLARQEERGTAGGAGVREAWTYAGTDGEVITTARWRILVNAEGGALRGALPGVMEAATAAYERMVGDASAGEAGGAKMELYVVASRPQWVRLTDELFGGKAGDLEGIERGGMTLGGASVLWDVGVRETLALAAHEGWHQWAQRRLREGLPAWVDEGIATQMEGVAGDEKSGYRIEGWRNRERFDGVRIALESGGLMPLREFLSVTPTGLAARGEGQRALAWYAQAWVLMRWLEEGEGGAHAGKVGRILRAAARGELAAGVEKKLGAGAADGLRRTREGTAVFRAYVMDDLGAAEGALTAYARRVARLGADVEIERGRSPVAE